MKVLTINEAREQLDAVCQEALAGEVIRLQRPDGALLELTAVPVAPSVTPLSDRQLAECYHDADWAAFENHCAKASHRGLQKDSRLHIDSLCQNANVVHGQPPFAAQQFRSPHNTLPIPAA